MLSQRELGWVAGFLEGEGSFHAPLKKSSNFGIQCSQVQREPLERLQKMFGGSIGCYNRSAQNRNHQPLHQWALSGYRAAGLMMTIWILMSPRRQEQIKTALLSWYKRPRCMRKIRSDARG